MKVVDRSILPCRDCCVTSESPTRFPEFPKVGETKSSHRTDWSHQGAAGDRASPPWIQEETAGPLQELMGLILVPNIHFSAGCTVWDMPIKRRIKKTFQIDLSLFLLPVFHAGDPVHEPTLEGGPGSGSLRRHLRLPSSL